MYKKIKNHILDSVYLKNTDIILAAYPKVGSTWIRFLFCNLLSLLEWNGKMVDFNLLNETMISFGEGKLREEWKYSIPRIVKTHSKYLPIFRKNRIILMLRDPRDIMISRYYYLKAKEKSISFFNRERIKSSDQENFTNFIQHKKWGFESFFKHYNSWEKKADIFIKYENFKKKPFEEFLTLLEKLNINVDQSTIAKAVKKSDIKNVSKVDDKEGHSKLRKFKKGFKFTRNGSIEQWKNYYNEEQLRIFKDYKERYNYSL